MDLQALRIELDTDPLGRGYASLNDEQAAQTFKINDRTPNRDMLDAGSLIASIVRADYTGLSATEKDYVRLIAMAQTLPLTAALKTELGAIFPQGSATRTNLVALLKRPGNRADELNLGGIPTTSDVADARRPA